METTVFYEKGLLSQHINAMFQRTVCDHTLCPRDCMPIIHFARTMHGADREGSPTSPGSSCMPLVSFIPIPRSLLSTLLQMLQEPRSARCCWGIILLQQLQQPRGAGLVGGKVTALLPMAPPGAGFGGAPGGGSSSSLMQRPRALGDGRAIMGRPWWRYADPPWCRDGAVPCGPSSETGTSVSRCRLCHPALHHYLLLLLLLLVL